MSVSPLVQAKETAVPDPCPTPDAEGAARPLTRPAAVEWPTLALVIACTAVWTGAVMALSFQGVAPYLAWPVIVLAIVLHSSLTHEAVHGHPTRSAWVNAALVFPAVGLFVPYGRFRDTHLAHHRDERLTDPYDDPESNYLDPAVWHGLPRIWRGILAANNTLAGRVLIGPAIGLGAFFLSDIREVARGNRAITRAWAVHVPALLVVGWWLWLWEVSLPGYLLAAYLGMGVLKIRTFLEHRAHEAVPERSVIVEDRGPLAFLFLNNNLHAVHHKAPGVAWYRLPAFYEARRARFLELNGGYRYGSYAEVFRRHVLSRKDPVAHPLMEPRR